MRAHLILPALAAAVAGACGGRADAASVAIDARPISRAVAVGQSTAGLESDDGGIEVRRILTASDPCRTLSAGLERARGLLTLRVVAVPDGRECPSAEAYFLYTARISDLAPGRYDLRVVHDTAGAPAAAVAPEHPVVVMEGSVEVP